MSNKMLFVVQRPVPLLRYKTTCILIIDAQVVCQDVIITTVITYFPPTLLLMKDLRDAVFGACNYLIKFNCKCKTMTFHSILKINTYHKV